MCTRMSLRHFSHLESVQLEYDPCAEIHRGRRVRPAFESRNKSATTLLVASSIYLQMGGDHIGNVVFCCWLVRCCELPIQR